ncbi:MAG: PAS domain-containing protein [Spirulinaceae cyanobacterium]
MNISSLSTASHDDRIHLQQLIVSLALQLMKADSTAISIEIEQALEALGKFFSVDGVFIAIAAEKSVPLKVTHHWITSGIIGLDFTHLQIPFEQFIGGDRLQQGKVVKINKARDLTSASDRAFWQNYQGKSLLALPLQNNENTFGILGFWSYHRSYPWLDSQIAALTQVAEILSHTLQRQLQQQTHLESQRRKQALYNAIPDLLLCIGSDGIYRDCLPAKNSQDLIKSNRVGKHLRDILPPEIAERQFLYIQQVLDTGETLCFEQKLCIDGVCRDQEVRMTVSGPDEVLLMIRDITAGKKIEKALQDSENLAALAFQGNNDGIWDWNVQTNEVFFSPRWKEMLGYQDSELPNHLSTWSDRIHPDDREGAMQAIQDHLDQKVPFYNTEHRLRCKDGSYKWILDRGKATWDENGNAIRMVGSHTDISDRKLAEAALQESEKRWQLALRGANDGIWDWNLATNSIFFSPRLLEMLGYEFGEWGDRMESWRDRVHPNDLDRVFSALQSHFDQETPFFDSEYRLRCKDGSYKWILDRGKATWDKDGNVTRMVGSHRDISDRKLAEAQLQQANRAFRTLSHCNQAIVRAQNETDLLQSICDILIQTCGYRLAWIGYLEHNENKTLKPMAKAGYDRGYVDSLHLTWADTPYGQGPVAKAVRSRSYCICPDISHDSHFTPWQKAAQERGYTSIIALPLLNNENNPFGVLTLYSTETNTFDDEEVKLLQELTADFAYGINALRDRRSLAESEEKFRQLTENIEDVFWMQNVENNDTLYVSPAYEQIWGRSCQSLYNNPSSYQEAINPEDRDRLNSLIQNSPNGYFDSEYRIIHPDGSVRWIWDRGFPIYDEQGNLYRKAGIAKDITERKQIEEMLRRSKDEMEQRVRQRTLELAQINEKLQQELRDRIAIEAQLRKSEKQYRTLVQHFPDGAVFLFDREGRHTIADGVGLTTQNLSREQLEKHTLEALPDQLLVAVRPLYEAALNGETLTRSVEYRDRIYTYQALPVRNEQGEVFAGMIAMQDITERAAIERMKDEFIAVVSHELRTPLTSIHGALNLLDSGLVQPDSPQGSRVIQIAAESAARLTRLVNDILELERLESGKIKLNPEPIQAVPLLQHALDQMYLMAHRSGVTLVWSAPDCQFIADRDRILQVLTNLLSNAIKFSDRDQTVSLHLHLTPDSLVFTVQDYGRGIHPDKIDCIFERFHQIDASDSRQKGGTGLGLAICRSIVEQHGGKIWVESTLNQGSCFYFSLRRQ